MSKEKEKETEKQPMQATTAAWAVLGESHPEIVRAIVVLQRLQALNGDVFRAIRETNLYGIARKIAAIEQAAGIEEDALKSLCPQRSCGVGISAARTERFLFLLKRNLKNINLAPEPWLKEVEKEVAAHNATGGKHWLTDRVYNQSSWLWSAARHLFLATIGREFI